MSLCAPEKSAIQTFDFFFSLDVENVGENVIKRDEFVCTRSENSAIQKLSVIIITVVYRCHANILPSTGEKKEKKKKKPGKKSSFISHLIFHRF